MADQRTIISTPTPGWFLDPESGKKTRKQEGDRIMTQPEYDQALLDAEPSQERPVDPQEQVENNGDVPAASTDDSEDAQEQKRQQTVRDAAAQAPVQLTSGKLATGKTVTIKCSHIDGVLHEKKWDELTPAEKRKACGLERTIKVQDAFQVRRCPDHQKAHRNALKREKTKQRKAARTAAKAS